jgi:squalene synthase HpnC
MLTAKNATFVSGDTDVIVCIPNARRAEIGDVTGQGARAVSVGPGAGRMPGVTETAAKASAENFPVAFRLLPARSRRHLMAVYVFARTVDDIGDLAPVADRSALLAEVEADITALYDGGAPRLAAVRGLVPVVRDCDVPRQLFIDLVEANRMDQIVTRYQTFDELLGYCRLSANPVGRIVLHIFGVFSPALGELSDHVCTALQLAEHWQDVAEDLAAGRVYLPAEDLAQYGCTEADLAAPSASAPVRRLISFEVARAGAVLDAGAPLIGNLRGAARAAVAGYVAGGRAALAAVAAADFDVLAGTPHPQGARVAAEFVLALARGR